ncbi:MAG TPA: glycoside hydrolase family 15 protein [Acidimicrobiia bacterium]|nr:glycoside hydrolase family 15 protein [Acidimicrobiia bacterium]
MAQTAGTYQPIEDYGIIGDLHTVAVVGKHGSIDFCSFPNFDSPTIFAALLDAEKGGRFSIRPHLDEFTSKQMYLPDTNVLMTRFLAEEGVGDVSDYMPVGFHPHDHPRVIVRRVKTVRGSMRFDVVFDPRFDYGRAEHTVEEREGEMVFASRGDDRTTIRLRTEAPMTIDRHGAARTTIELGAGESLAFMVEEVGDHLASPCSEAGYASRAFKDTVNFWRAWIGRATYQGRWREMVHRSALTLKLLVSETHGSLIASPTFGLPEEIGGVRNWDYRFTWIRDASFTLYALNRLGYTEEAGRFMQWIHARCMDLEPDGSLRIMYGHDGGPVPTEEMLDHLEGYRGSRPVRIGNGAAGQLQLDIYGELLDAIYLYNELGEPIPYQLWQNIVRLVDYVVASWRLPDDGIWEVRGGQQQFFFSRLMCWVAVDRGIRLADRRSFPCPFERWRSTRDEIYRDLMDNFYDERRGAFVQHRGATNVDAASLIMPLVKFVGPTDPRFLGTLRAISEDLVEDSLVFRYRTDDAASDGLTGDEGTFSMCSFWFAEAVARSGDVQRGRFLFEKMLGYSNHLGLYAEELGPRGEHLGNFPQAFTHLALISAAHAIDRKLSRAGWVA